MIATIASRILICSYQLPATSYQPDVGISFGLTTNLDDGIVVVRVRHRLSALAKGRLMVNFTFADWKKDVLESAADRFERRLTEETGKLRVEMARMETRLIAWMFVLWLGQHRRARDASQVGALTPLI